MQIFTKSCTVCDEEKPANDYYNSAKSKDGKSYRCKTCDNNARASYIRNNRDRHLAMQKLRNRKSKYGLTDIEYTDLIDTQKNKCAICKIEFDENVIPCVDHSHVTGKVRGLLCAKCNKGLGLFNDDSYVLYLASLYLS